MKCPIPPRGYHLALVITYLAKTLLVIEERKQSNRFSTWLRLLQYFIGDYSSTSQEITPVLGRDYSSTWCRLLQYLGQVLAQKDKSYFTN